METEKLFWEKGGKISGKCTEIAKRLNSPGTDRRSLTCRGGENSERSRCLEGVRSGWP
jgi:hypothetical protein